MIFEFFVHLQIERREAEEGEGRLCKEIKAKIFDEKLKDTRWRINVYVHGFYSVTKRKVRGNKRGKTGEGRLRKRSGKRNGYAEKSYIEETIRKKKLERVFYELVKRINHTRNREGR